MDLTELLTAAVEHIPGAVAISLVGMDGVAVETVAGPKPMMGTSRAARPEEGDVAAWEVEVADLMLGARRAARSLNWGALKSLLLETDDLTFMMRLVKADYFLLLALDSATNMARARFEFQRVASSLSAEL